MNFSKRGRTQERRCSLDKKRKRERDREGKEQLSISFGDYHFTNVPYLMMNLTNADYICYVVNECRYNIYNRLGHLITTKKTNSLKYKCSLSHLFFISICTIFITAINFNFGCIKSLCIQ